MTNSFSSDAAFASRRPAGEGHSSGARRLMDGYAEVVSRIADAADRFATTVSDNDPRFGARTTGDVIRQAPLFYRRAAMALNDSLINVLDLRNWRDPYDYEDDPVSVAGETVAVAVRRPPDAGEAEIVAAAQRYILRGRQTGATLDGLLRYLRPVSGFSDAELTTLLSRHFLVDGDLVFPSRADDPRALTDLPDNIADHLKALGYADLRRDVPLERAPDAPPARLVGYDESGVPQVLVVRTAAGALAAPQTDEDARFQAKALSSATPPRYLYLTDGRFNRYLDTMTGNVIKDLPRTTVKSSSKA